MEAKKAVSPLKISTPLEKIPEFHPSSTPEEPKETTLDEIEKELERVKKLIPPGMSDQEKQHFTDGLLPPEVIPWILVGGNRCCERELMKYYAGLLNGNEKLAYRAGCREYVRQLTALSEELPYDSYFMIFFPRWTPISYVAELAETLHEFCGGNIERLHIQSNDGALAFMGYRHDAEMLCDKVHEFCKKKRVNVDFKAYAYHHTPMRIASPEAVSRLISQFENYQNGSRADDVQWFLSALKEAAAAGFADPAYVKELFKKGGNSWLESVGLTPDQLAELVEKARLDAETEHEPDDQPEEESEEEEEEEEEEESEDESVSQP